MNLRRQFTRRNEDESSRESGSADSAPRNDPFDHGQPEGGRLAGTRLRAREEISARQDGGDGLGLYRRGPLISEARQR